MKDLRHSRTRWHDQLIRRGYGTDAYGPEFDPYALPKQQRRDLALQLAAQAFDLEYLEHRYRVRLKPRDLATIPEPERVNMTARLATQGCDLAALEERYGVTLTPELIDPNLFTEAEKRTLCTAFWQRGHAVADLEARFGITRKANA